MQSLSEPLLVSRLWANLEGNGVGVGKAPNRTHSPENIKICEKCLNRGTKFYEYTKKGCALLLGRGLWLSRVFAMVTAVSGSYWAGAQWVLSKYSFEGVHE